MTDEELIAHLRLQGLDKDVAAADRIEQLVKSASNSQRMNADFVNVVFDLTRKLEAAEAKVHSYELKDGMDGAVVDMIRNILNTQKVPQAAFIDDHVANAIVQRNKANNKVSMAVRAIKIALTGWQSELVQYEMTEDLEEMAVVKEVLAELEKTE